MEPHQNPQQPAFNRACESCRMHKIRCLPNTPSISFPDSKSCVRCLRTDRQCVFTTSQKRKQRKRTDTRVAELGNEVQSMRVLFESKLAALSQHSQPDDRILQADNFGVPIACKSPRHTITLKETFCSLPAMPSSSMASSDVNGGFTLEQQNLGVFSSTIGMDVVDRGIVSWTTAEELFRIYITDLFPHYPAVYFPPGTSPAAIRRSKPTLFLAVIATASAKIDTGLYSTLHSEVAAAYTQRAVVNSEKSIELVHAQLVTSAWYYPPGSFSRLKSYEYIHMAVIMGMDIGLGSNPSPSRRYGASSEETPCDDEPDRGKIEEELVRRRTVLVLYMMSTSVSMNQRRPSMLRKNNWIIDCVRFLGVHGSQAALDHTLVAWLKLLQITEEIVSSFSLDEPNNTANLAELQVQIMLNGYEQSLLGWKESFEPSGAINAIHDDHDPATMLPSYKAEKIISIASEIHATSTYIKSTSMIISSCHALLECLLCMDIGVLRSLPILNFVRMTYTVLILAKLHISSKTPTSLIGSVLDPGIIKLGYYLEAVIDKLGMAVGSMECHAPLSFLGLLMRLQIWYKGQESDIYFKPPLDLYKVPEDCWLPPPPRSRNGRDPAGTLRLDAASLSRQLDTPVLDPLTENSLGMPLFDSEIDWSNPDLNQLLNFGIAGANNCYAGWLPPMELGSDQRSLKGVDWTTPGVNKTPF